MGVSEIVRLVGMECEWCKEMVAFEVLGVCEGCMRFVCVKCEMVHDCAVCADCLLMHEGECDEM